MIKQLDLSDIHFGHPRLDPGILYRNLINFIYPEIKDIQILFFTGDLFHNILSLSHPASYWAIMFINRIFEWAEEFGFKIRLIRGTFSHDRDQQHILNSLNTRAIDCKVINDIEIETLKDWNNGSDEVLRVTYIPDSLPYKNSKQIIAKIKELFQLVGWDKTDLVIGHGTFAHSLPDNINLPACTFDIDQFTDIVDGYIIMGHIHTPSKRKNVIYVGSFDRMSHGEEENKGYLICTKDKEHWKFRFIENTEAVKFFTIVPKGNNHGEVIKSFVSLVEKKFPDKKGNVRIIHNDPEIKSILNRICATKFPNIRFSVKADKNQRSELQLSQLDTSLTSSLDSEVLNLDGLCVIITNALATDDKFKRYNYVKEDILDAITKLGVTT